MSCFTDILVFWHGSWDKVVMDKEDFKCKSCGFEYGNKTFVGDGTNWFWTCKWCTREHTTDLHKTKELIKEKKK